MFRFHRHSSRRLLAGQCPSVVAALSALSSPSPMQQLRHQSQAAAKPAVNPARITKAAVWGLWNEGNLFSMTVPELEAFLQASGIEFAAGQKKAALVRKAEEFMAKENPVGIVNAAAAVDTVATVAASHTERQAGAEYRSAVADLYDEADVYAVWTNSIDERKHDDFISFPSQEHKKQELDPKGHSYLDTKAYQLLHQECTSDLGLAKVNVSGLPGCSGLNNAAAAAATLSVVSLPSDAANKLRFRRGFHWAVTNMWSASIDAEVNIGAGKVLYWKSAAKQQRPVLPLWTCQQFVHDTHPYSWYAVAHETSVPDLEALTSKLGMTMTSENEVSYKVYVKRSRDVLDIDLNASLQPTLVNRPWERFLVTHYVRQQMPDLRFLVRGRHQMKKRIADQYLEASILTANGSTVQSVLQPELGDVIYVGHRAIRRWTTKMANGVRIQLVETRRTPLVTTRPGDEGERIEYEMIANVPQQSENVDIPALAEELWERGGELATTMEKSLQELHAFTMSSAAAFIAPTEK